MIRVAMLDDHQITLDGYFYRLEFKPDIEIVGVARFGEDLEQILETRHVDVLLLDINVPTSKENPNPYPILFLLPRILQIYPHLSVIAITMIKQRSMIQAVMEAGASAYILKEDYNAIRTLESIVRGVIHHEIYISPLAEQALKRNTQEDTQPSLSARQLEVLSLSAAYPQASTAELAEKINVAHSTLRNQLSGAYLKLNVRNRASAIQRAQQLGLIPTDSRLG